MFNDPNNNLIKLGGNPCELRATRFVSGPLTDRGHHKHVQPRAPVLASHTAFSRVHTHTFAELLSP